MSSEEKTRDESVEKLAEALSDGMGEENVAKEAPEIEINLDDDVVEEVSADEETLDDNNVEQASTESVKIEEATVEAETTESEEPVKKKSKKAIIITASVIAAVLLIALGVYMGISSYYKERFLMGTYVNGVDCSGKTLDEVEAMLQKEVEEYSLTVYKTNGESEVIEGTTIDIKYGGYKELKEAFEKQNVYAWPKALFNENRITAEIVFEYSPEKLDTIISELECMKTENQVPPVSASIVYGGEAFVIQNEVYGTQLDATKVNEVIHAGVSAMNESVNLEESACYVQPIYKADSPEVVAALNEVNKYISTKVTYSLDNIEVIVDKDEIAPWVSVDANMTTVIDAAKVKAFTDTLGSKYNTSNRSGTIITPTGKEAAVAVAGYGRQIDSQADCNQLISEIKAGQTVTRSPIISRQATPEGQFAWGTTYLEVDITEQHMWYIVNGQIALETDVVTGKKGVNDTPTGTYSIVEKVKGKYLRGRLVNGKPSYITWVDYWMRVTWSGIGFHDAGWQNGIFGGDRYVTNGSHGCINMPPEKAKELFGMLSIGCPVVIHY